MDSMKDMPRAVIEKLSSAQKNFYDDFLKIGRGEVDSLSLDGIISHEYGHHIDITSLRKMDKSRSYYENFESKAMKLSAYENFANGIHCRKLRRIFQRRTRKC